MPRAVVEEGLRRDALPHQLALEVGSDDRDGVDRPVGDGGLQLGKGQHGGRGTTVAGAASRRQLLAGGANGP